MEDIKLINGDCIEVMKEIADKSIDCVICDLPYGTTSAFWDCVIPFDKLWKEYNRICKNDAAIILFGQEPFSTYLRMSNIKNYRYDWIWHKNTTSGFALARKQPMRNHENISVFYKKQPTYNPIKEPRDLNEDSKKRMEYDFTSTKGNNQLQGIAKVQFIPGSTTMSYPKTVKKFNNIPNNSKERFHPTQKPVALLEYLIKTYSNEGDTILDNTMGSGSTGIAAVNTNRKFIGIELDENYFNIAKKRIDDAIREKKQSLF